MTSISLNILYSVYLSCTKLVLNVNIEGYKVSRLSLFLQYIHCPHNLIMLKVKLLNIILFVLCFTFFYHYLYCKEFFLLFFIWKDVLDNCLNRLLVQCYFECFLYSANCFKCQMLDYLIA